MTYRLQIRVTMHGGSGVHLPPIDWETVDSRENILEFLRNATVWMHEHPGRPKHILEITRKIADAIEAGFFTGEEPGYEETPPLTYKWSFKPVRGHGRV